MNRPIDIPPMPFETMHLPRRPRLPLPPPEMQEERGPPDWLWWLGIGLMIGSPLWIAIGAVLIFGVQR